jgi:hypothetical protein
MNHLTPSEFVDLVDGHLPRERVRHVESCGMCGAQVEDLRRALFDSSAADVPEPSPLFWERFAERVRDGIDEPKPHAWWLHWPGWNLRSTVAAAAILAIAVAIGWRMVRLPEQDVPSRGLPIAEVPDAGSSPIESAPDDAWNAVRAAAETAAWEDVQEAGIAAPADAAEAAILRLSDSERRQLMTLIEEELKRSGD